MPQPLKKARSYRISLLKRLPQTCLDILVVMILRCENNAVGRAEGLAEYDLNSQYLR